MAPTPRRSKIKAAETPEKMQDDHEKFLQAFEKPTQIYRFLRSRHTIAPIFLQRTLSYMKHTGNIDLNSSKPGNAANLTHRHNGGAKKVKVDSILSSLTSKVTKQQQKENETHMNLAFTGLFTKVSSRESSPRRTRSPNQTAQSAATTNNTVTVDVMLLKVCHKKRKDIISPVVEVPLGSLSIPLNPSTTDHGATMTATADHVVSIPRSSFTPFNSHTVKSYKLHLTVTTKVPAITKTNTPTTAQSGSHCKSEGSTLDPSPPPAKRRRTSPMTGPAKLQPPSTDHTTVSSTTGGSAVATYTTDLVVFDRGKRCLLSDGFYELSLQRLEQNNCLRQHTAATWEVFLDGKNVSHFDSFSDQPILAFHLCWGKPEMISTTSPATAAQSPAKSTALSRRGSVTSSADLSDGKKKPVNHRVFYQFIYSNTLRQITECREATQCPWCSLNVPGLYSLLKHLRLCHSRFTFTYVPHPKGARIDVTLNENFDGSYAGNPQDMCSNTGFHRDSTSHRTPVTNILVFRPRRVKPTLTEFTDNEHTDCDVTRQYMSGHNRLYYHSASTLPTRPKELEEDSEAEPDPDWLRDQTQRLIDEFTDVNTGEKDVMKMWNLHIMKHCYIADFQMPIACRTFVEEHAATLASQGLTKNFILHLSNLYDFSLINDGVMNRTIASLQAATSELNVDQTPGPPSQPESSPPAVTIEPNASCDTTEKQTNDEMSGLLQTVPTLNPPS